MGSGSGLLTFVEGLRALGEWHIGGCERPSGVSEWLLVGVVWSVGVWERLEVVCEKPEVVGECPEDGGVWPEGKSFPFFSFFGSGGIVGD